MKKITATALIAVSACALLGVSTAAYAATAATLPVGDTIYQTNYSSDPTQLWTTASDGTATLIGTPSTSLGDVVDGAWNPATGRSYIIANGYDGPCELWEVDVTTGDLNFVATITGASGDTADCDAFDVAPDGTAWITMYDGTTDAVLAKLNLSDGTTSAAVPLSYAINGISWIVVQPSTGVLFLGTFSGVLYTINTGTGADALVDPVGYEVGSIYDAAFDSNGRLWLTSWPEATVLLSADVADFSASLVEQGPILIDGAGDTGTDSIWIARAPAPALAATGFDATLPLAAGLGLLVLGAGALVVRRTRRA